jgi:hypothetical protein
MSMEYITAQETGTKWNITRRRVLILCGENRILGAIKVANLWLIPKDAEKPVDLRRGIKKRSIV